MVDGYRLIVRQHGGPEAIVCEPCSFDQPGPGELLIETEAVGLNFIDIYYRGGLYPGPLPIALGSESVGTVLSVGADVTSHAVGDRIGCVQGDGAYASHRIVKVSQAVKLPVDISSEIAAATMLKGFTSSYLAEDIIDLKAGDLALVHSAAGGVGSLLVPWLRHKGVMVIAHAGTPEKLADVDADIALSCPFDELSGAVLRATNGRKVDVGLRRGRQGLLGCLPGLLAEARIDGELRQCVRCGSARLANRSDAGRFSHGDPADDGGLHQYP